MALARHPTRCTRPGPGMSTAAADVLDRVGLAEAVAGAEAVVSTLGIGASKAPTIVYSEWIANVLHPMNAPRTTGCNSESRVYFLSERHWA
jgi:putative NADH-flavin reductase